MGEAMLEKVKFDGRIVMIGYGSVGQCVLPVIPRHFEMPADRVTVIEADDHSETFAPFAAMGMRHVHKALTRSNLIQTLSELLRPGDLCLNLSVGVDATEILDWCQHHGVLYVDTSLEPWPEKYEDTSLPEWSRTHYDAHQRLRDFAAGRWKKGGPTAVVTHGANPGIVNQFVKAALLEIGARTGLDRPTPSTRAEWAEYAEATGTRVIHIAERDTQYSSIPRKPDEFVNTWSIPGFWGEAYFATDMGWGTHEKTLPPKAKHFQFGPGNAIYLAQPSGTTVVRSWVPKGGPIVGLAISHSESITLSHYLTVWEDGRPRYRPTVHYAYHPTSDAIISLRELIMRDWEPPKSMRIMTDDVVDGIDELGVLLLGHKLGGLWYGSQLSIHEARKIVPHQNATALQVCAGVISAAVWAARNPNAGYCEPEDLPHEEILAIARPYLGPVVAVPTDWTPLKGRSRMFPEPWLDQNDPWQFTNFLVR